MDIKITEEEGIVTVKQGPTIVTLLPWLFHLNKQYDGIINNLPDADEEFSLDVLAEAEQGVYALLQEFDIHSGNDEIVPVYYRYCTFSRATLGEGISVLKERKQILSLGVQSNYEGTMSKRFLDAPAHLFLPNGTYIGPIPHPDRAGGIQYTVPRDVSGRFLCIPGSPIPKNDPHYPYYPECIYGAVTDLQYCRRTLSWRVETDVMLAFACLHNAQQKLTGIDLTLYEFRRNPFR